MIVNDQTQTPITNRYSSYMTTPLHPLSFWSSWFINLKDVLRGCDENFEIMNREAESFMMVIHDSRFTVCGREFGVVGFVGWYSLIRDWFGPVRCCQDNVPLCETNSWLSFTIGQSRWQAHSKFTHDWPSASAPLPKWSGWGGPMIPIMNWT